MHGLYDVIDFIDLKHFRNELVKFEVPFHGHVGEGRDIPVGIDIAIQRTFYGLSMQRGIRVRYPCHLPFRGNADLDQFPAKS